jgi:hypothetical protein
MSTMQWIGVTIGGLILLTRLPAIIWPGPYRERIRGILEGSGPTGIRSVGAFLWVLVVAVVVLVLDQLSLLEGVLLILAVLFAAAGAVALFAPADYRRFAVGVLGRTPDWAARVGGVVGVALGAWIMFLSWRGH